MRILLSSRNFGQHLPIGILEDEDREGSYEDVILVCLSGFLLLELLPRIDEI
jgi:hypothetical protein